MEDKSRVSLGGEKKAEQLALTSKEAAVPSCSCLCGLGGGRCGQLKGQPCSL